MVTMHEVTGDTAIRGLFPLLLLAEPSERALRWGLDHLVTNVYRFEDDGQTVGAATLRWNDDPCELQELAVAEELQGRGYGKQMVALLFAEARHRGKRAMLVGTSNAAIGNIAFYQKCGFRMDSVRQNYFRYYAEPVYEHGIQTRDMLMFRYDL